MILNGDLLDATRHELQSRPGGVARPVHPGSDEAVHTLNHALALAEPDGYMRVFVDEGAPTADCCGLPPSVAAPAYMAAHHSLCSTTELP